MEQMEEKLKEAREAEELLDKIFYYMNQLVEAKGFYSTIMLLTDLGRTLVNSDRASFWYWDKIKKQYWTMAALGSEQIIVPEGEGAVGFSIEHNEVLVMNDPYQDARFNPEIDKKTGYLTKSILCMPILDSKGEVIGAYQAINKIGDSASLGFGEKDIKRLTLAAVYCGKTLESNLLYRETLVDPLTTLKNRRGYQEYYEDFVKPQLNQGHKASMIMCDIDFFKKVNDSYGHNAGDFVLKRISGILLQNADKKGEVIRWGGEEFILLLRDYDLSKTAQLAEEIRKQIEDTEMNFENKTIQITMSFGVGEIDGDKNSNENVQIVDAKLYQAKQTGRNKVVI